MGWTRKSHVSSQSIERGYEPFVHWYRDNQVYFITARCQDRFPAFASEEAKAIFWDRFQLYTAEADFFPWVTSLMANHYHTLGYCRYGQNLKDMMRKLHGSVAKLVNDRLPRRQVPFWHARGNQSYFDGCIRDELQCRRAYRYTLRQAVRHGHCPSYRQYPHTRIAIPLEKGLGRALELNAFLPDVPYKRYRK